MTKKTHDLIGRINNKQKVKVYQGDRKGQYYYTLEPVIENQEGVKKIFVFDDIVSSNIWQDIEEGNFYKKEYKFTCERWKTIPSNYKLLDWEQLKSHGEKN